MAQADNILDIGQGYHALYHNIQTRRAYGYGVVSGGTVTPGSDGGVSVDVASGTAVWNEDAQSIPSQTSLSLASPNSTDPRKDIIVYSGGGTVEAITGTPNPVDDAQSSATRFETYQPSPPDGTGGDYVVLAEVWVAAGTSTIQSADINDLRTDPAVVAHGVTITDDVVTENGVVLIDRSEAQMGAGTVDTSAIQTDAVTSANVAVGAIGSTQIAADAVTATEIDLSISPTWTGEHTFQKTSFVDDLEFDEGATLIHDRDEVTGNVTTDGTGYYLVDTDAAGSSVTVTLASSDAAEGREVNIKRDGKYNVVIVTEGAETIDGSNSVTLNSNQQSVTLVYNNVDSDWEIW